MSIFEGNSVQRVQHPECEKLTVLIELEEEAHRIVERRVATRARHCISCAVPILAGSAIPATSAVTTAAAAILGVGAEEERAERHSEKRGSDHLSRGFQSLLATLISRTSNLRLALIDTTSFVQETIETRAERPFTTLSHLEASVGVREGSEANSQ
jgi:hypothetical protein